MRGVTSAAACVLQPQHLEFHVLCMRPHAPLHRHPCAEIRRLSVPSLPVRELHVCGLHLHVCTACVFPRIRSRPVWMSAPCMSTPPLPSPRVSPAAACSACVRRYASSRAAYSDMGDWRDAYDADAGRRRGGRGSREDKEEEDGHIEAHRQDEDEDEDDEDEEDEVDRQIEAGWQAGLRRTRTKDAAAGGGQGREGRQDRSGRRRRGRQVGRAGACFR